MHSAILTRKPLAREVAKGGASSLSKLALSAGSTAGELWEGRMRACGGRDAYHYLFGVQTNSEMDANHYSFVVQTYSGSRVDLYRSQLPSHGGGGGGRFALRSHLHL